MPHHLRNVAFIGIAAIVFGSACGGSTSETTFVIHARLFNAAVGTHTISLQATAPGTTTIGTAAAGLATSYVAVDASPLQGAIGQTSFEALEGTTPRVALAAPVTNTSQDTVVYVTPEGGQAAPVLKLYPEDQNTNPSGQFRVDLVNVAPTQGISIDLYLLDAQGTTANQGPLFRGVGVYGAQGFSVLTNVPQGSRLAITQTGQKAILREVPFPSRSLTASGNFSIFYSDVAGGDTKITLLDNTRS